MVKQNLCSYLSQNDKKPQNNLDECIASTGLSNDFRRPTVDRATLTGPDLQGLKHTMVYTVQCQKLHSKSIGFQFLFKGQGGEAQLTHGQNTKKRDFQRIVVDDRHYRVLPF